MEVSYLLYGVAIIIVVIGILLSKANKDHLSYVAWCVAAIVALCGVIQTVEESWDEQKLARENLLASYNYEAYILDGRIIPAENCELKNDHKVCEILEYSYNEGSDENTIKVVVEDFWKK